MNGFKSVITTILFMSSSLNISAQDFKIIAANEARRLMSKHKPVFIKKLDRNNSSVFKINPNDYVIVSEESKYSLVFNKIEELDKIEKMEYYQTGLETDDIRESEQHGIIDIPNAVNEYVKELEDKFKITLNYKDISILDSLDNKIEKFGVVNLSERDVFIISLYLDNFFRINTEDTFWSIEKIYTLNTYWIPYLRRKDNSGEFSFFRAIFNSYIENESGLLNLKLNYLLQLADYMGYQPLSDEHMNFIKSFNDKSSN